MNESVLSAHERGSGKSKVKQVRRRKMIPGVFYAAKEQAVPIAFAELELKKTLAEDSALIRLKMPDGRERECVVREIQRDPVWGNILHVDLMGITRGLKLTATVPLHVTGDPAGVKEGGILEHVQRELEVECFPRYLPRYLECDVSALNIGESLRVEGLEFENIKILTDPQSTIATVVPPRVEKVVVEEAEEVEGEEAEEAPEEEEEREKKTDESE